MLDIFVYDSVLRHMVKFPTLYLLEPAPPPPLLSHVNMCIYILFICNATIPPPPTTTKHDSHSQKENKNL